MSWLLQSKSRQLYLAAGSGLSFEKKLEGLCSALGFALLMWRSHAFIGAASCEKLRAFNADVPPVHITIISIE